VQEVVEKDRCESQPRGMQKLLVMDILMVFIMVIAQRACVYTVLSDSIV
jgi:hypothetical protein